MTNGTNSETAQAKSRSSDLFERACRVMPGGVSRNTVLRSPHPLYAEKGEGCYVTDVEGVKRIDFANNMCSLIHGHAHPAVVAAVTAQLQKGTAFTTATEAELLFAEHLCKRSESFDKVRFVNSGTEAVMGCIKAARAFTGRPKIAKVEGAYHGTYDYAEVSQTASPATWGNSEKPKSVPVAHGTPESALSDVVVIPFNEPELAINILNSHAKELACILVDLVPHRVGLNPASAGFIRLLRKWADDNGVLLVYDEVITYRFAYGGTQELFEERPDLTAMGKFIGGGFPIGALAGKKEVMDVMNPLQDKLLFPHSGTFSANPVTMTAGLTAMELYDKEAVGKINLLGQRARKNIREAIDIAGIQACVAGIGSMFRVHLKADIPKNFREAYMSPEEAQKMKVLLAHLFDNGIMLINTCSGVLSTPMTTTEIDTIGEVMLGGFRKIKNLEKTHD